ncbi:MAG: S-methyl-5-thioribose-1-phosphate isomerase, partial [Proteobacteria bacterium]|nr:S-methyl-5-thioribose-1-phosphate isomerase [Pseudomonadota bacterium]
MKVNGNWCRAIAVEPGDPVAVKIIDQRWLPHKFVWTALETVGDVVASIADMQVRGAPLIGATGAWGVYLAVLRKTGSQEFGPYFQRQCARIRSARPTAVNLAWAVDRVQKAVLAEADPGRRAEAARAEAAAITDLEVENCKSIGRHGAEIIEKIHRE